VFTYEKEVVASDLQGSKSQAKIHKLINKVQRNAQVEFQIIKVIIQEEMEVKLKE